MTLGEKIYQLRKQKGYSQEELAEKLNISRQSVSLWENNQTVPSIDCLIELSKLFGVTLDEICGNNIDDNNKKTLEDALSETTFEFTEKKARKLIKILQSTRRALLIVGVNLIIIGIMILAKNQFVPFLILDIFVNIFIIVFYIRSDKKNILSFLKEKKAVQITFFNDHFTSYSKAKNSFAKYDIEYSNVSNLIITDEITVIVFDRKYLVVDTPFLNENVEIFEKLKQGASKVSNNTKTSNKTLRTWSITLFVLSFASIFFGAFLWVFVSQFNKYSFVDDTIILNSWAFYIAALIPLSSLIFGICLHKRFKCKKNIIAGAIITVCLFIYGSFCFIFKPYLNFDKEILSNFSNQTNIEFPTEYLLVKNDLSIYNETYVKFTNETEVEHFEEEIKASSKWQDVKYLTNNIYLPIYTKVSTYDVFLLYELDNVGSLDTNYDKILFAYNFDENILIIYEIETLPNNN